MPVFQASDCKIHYEDEGTGPPILLIHGLWLSGRFFHKQIAALTRSHRTIVPDLRGHGRSEKVDRGHTVPQQARDLKALVEHLELEDIVLVGWSSGAFCIWDWVDQFGTGGLAGTVVIDESPTDFRWPDWSLGEHTMASLVALMRAVQTDFEGLVRSRFVPSLFRSPPTGSELAWMVEEVLAVPPAIASAVAFDELTRDYRSVLARVDVPTLVCFGAHDRALSPENGHYLARALPRARLSLFEQSGHAPFYEEATLFNSEIETFFQSL